MTITVPEAVVKNDTTLAAERLRMALDLFVTGEAIMRQNLRRKYPDSSEEEISARLAAWLRERPGAEHGDAAGKPVEWPRRTP